MSDDEGGVKRNELRDALIVGACRAGLADEEIARAFAVEERHVGSLVVHWIGNWRDPLGYVPEKWLNAPEG